MNESVLKKLDAKNPLNHEQTLKLLETFPNDELLQDSSITPTDAGYTNELRDLFLNIYYNATYSAEFNSGEVFEIQLLAYEFLGCIAGQLKCSESKGPYPSSFNF